MYINERINVRLRTLKTNLGFRKFTTELPVQYSQKYLTEYYGILREMMTKCTHLFLEGRFL